MSHNKNLKRNTLFRIVNGEGFYIYEGKKLSRKEMDKKFPTPRMVIKPNPDKSKDWMNES
jgi:hypothetical protein